jgi:hypothetical protein
MVVLTLVSTYILILPFYLSVFDVNGQTNLIFELLCDLIHCRNENYTTRKIVKETNAESEIVTADDIYI